LILAALYKFLAWESPAGNDCYLLANDEGQAADDLKLCKKLIAVNPLLSREVTVLQKSIERADGKGSLMILPSKDAIGAHGKTFLFFGYDELHGYKNWDVLEALAPDPSRLDSLVWITAYSSIYNSPGFPLFDLMAQAKRGEDPRMYFSWYSSEYCTDPDYAEAEPEARANPSMPSWENPTYLAQQRRRLPSHEFRRLHLNLPGMPDGAFLECGARHGRRGRWQKGPAPGRGRRVFGVRGHVGRLIRRCGAWHRALVRLAQPCRVGSGRDPNR
jgi:hypothetical protein